MAEILTLNVGAGFQTRLAVKDCDDEWIKASDVSAITYTIFQKNWTNRTAITNHENVTVPTSSFLATPATDAHTEESYNFEHVITQATSNPFPDYNRVYIIQYRFVGTDGVAHIHEMIGRTEE